MKSIGRYEFSVVGEAREWVSKHVGCLAGRREMQKGRIMINAVANKLDVLMGYAAFVSALHRREAVACLFIPIHTGMESANTTVVERLQPLAELMSVLSSANPEELVSGGHLGKVIRTSCPVTNHIMDFDDFNGIAFTPEAMNREDPLYDPMMSAPFPCMTLNSDHFAFSMFTRDLCLADHGCEVYQLDDPTLRRQLFERAGTKWQVMACRTIANYVAITDGTLCPTWLAEDERHWYASHQDPAFAESSKELHRHEMPAIYTPRIIAAWETSFATNKPPRLSDATTVGSLCPNALAQAG